MSYSEGKSPTNKPTLGVFGPKTPDRTGVAQYIATSIPYLSHYFDCNHIGSSDTLSPYTFDHVLYHIGNNKYHAGAFTALNQRAGVVVLHEFNNLDYYYSCWDGLLPEERTLLIERIGSIVNEKFDTFKAMWAYFDQNPAVDRYSLEAGCEELVLKKAKAVIVHSVWVQRHLDIKAGKVPVQVIPFPVREIVVANTLQIRRRFGFTNDEYIFGMFGFLGEYKRVEKVIAAWQGWAERPENVRLLIVGERQYDVHIPDVPWIIETGYVSDRDFEDLLVSVDCCIQLRYPSLGETSGVISHLVAHSRPVIVSDIPQMEELKKHPEVRCVSVGQDEVKSLITAMRSAYQTPTKEIVFRRQHLWEPWAKEVAKCLGDG